MDDKNKIINNIYYKLFQLATGNVKGEKEISKSGKNLQEIEQLVVLLAEKLEQVNKRARLHLPFFEYENGYLFGLVLTPEAAIVEVCHNTSSYLGYQATELKNKPLTHIVYESQNIPWHKIKKEIKQNKGTTITLTYQTKNQKIIVAKSTFTTLPDSGNLLLIAIKTIQKVVWDSLQNEEHGNRNDQEVITVQKVINYILTNLHLPLPTTRKLAIMFKTNEYDLKKMFRDHSNRSIYQFYNNERLKKAHALIEQTNTSLLDIALNCGFNDYNSFLIAFKKKFNYTPRQLKRP